MIVSITIVLIHFQIIIQIHHSSSFILLLGKSLTIIPLNSTNASYFKRFPLFYVARLNSFLISSKLDFAFLKLCLISSKLKPITSISLSTLTSPPTYLLCFSSHSMFCCLRAYSYSAICCSRLFRLVFLSGNIFL